MTSDEDDDEEEDEEDDNEESPAATAASSHQISTCTRDLLSGNHDCGLGVGGIGSGFGST